MENFYEQAIGFRKFIEEFRRKYLFPKDEYPPIIQNKEIKDFDSLYPSTADEIGKENVDEVIKEIKGKGVEAIAFYAPFHFYERWGVYFFEEKLYALAYFILKSLGPQPHLSFYEVLEVCFRSILEHEIFHFKTELFSTIAEEMIRHPSIYAPYFQRNQPYSQLEEALANAFMISSRIVIPIKKEMENICNNSPPGYKDYHKYVTRKTEGVLEHTKNILGDEALVSHARFFERTLKGRSLFLVVPTHMISIPINQNEKTLLFLLANERIEDLVKWVCKEYNCKSDVHRGPHNKIIFPNGESVPFSRSLRKGIPPYLVKEIAQKLGMDKKELLKKYNPKKYGNL
jgi:hypothetical protein